MSSAPSASKTESSTQTSAQGTAAIQAANKMFSYSMNELVNNAENIIPIRAEFCSDILSFYLPKL